MATDERGGLGRVDQGGCQLAGLVDAEGRGEKILLFLGERLEFLRR